MPRKMTTMEFIKKARKIHGDKYEYERAIYLGSNSKITITCPEHGDFLQIPPTHLSGSGCPKCGYRWFTFKDFLAKAKIVHGERYEYANTDYQNSRTKVAITCPKPGHGDFRRSPRCHLSGRGCPKCGYGSLTQEEFIQQATAKHGGKYTYAHVTYEGSNAKVAITCAMPGHGDFRQKPISHLRGAGCPLCGQISCHNKQRNDIADFVERANIAHGGKYTYANVKYTGALRKVAITCNVPGHGDFMQTPHDHLRGFGCPTCGGNTRLTTGDFVRRASEKHAGKYLYAKVVYKSGHTKVTITCPAPGHGDFRQLPADHLRGVGCPKCARVAPLSLEEFIERATELHSGKYSYTHAVYKNNHTKVVISCPLPRHGDFQQTPGNHLTGAGCPKCAESKGERAIDQILRSLRKEFIREYRIDACRYKRPLPFDFAIIEKGALVALIEFQGEQHYETERFFGMSGSINKAFAVVRKRDAIKRQYCEENRIPLLIIPFARKDEAHSMIRNFLTQL